MCGRYSITTPPEAIQRIFEVPERLNMPARYNVAPTQDAPVVRLGDDDARHLNQLRWGLVPFWADDPGIGARMINARAESAADKPAFRVAFQGRRCLVVADGFYEWQKPAIKGGRKQPFRIVRHDERPFAFAGLWERWQQPESEAPPLETFTILTTDANARVRPIHERMPVMLDETQFDGWLDPQASRSSLERLLRPYPAEKVHTYAVSTRVNKVENDDPAVIAPTGDHDVGRQGDEAASSESDAPSSGGQGRLL